MMASSLTSKEERETSLRKAVPELAKAAIHSHLENRSNSTAHLLQSNTIPNKEQREHVQRRETSAKSSWPKTCGCYPECLGAFGGICCLEQGSFLFLEILSLRVQILSPKSAFSLTPPTGWWLRITLAGILPLPEFNSSPNWEVAQAIFSLL